MKTFYAVVLVVSGLSMFYASTTRLIKPTKAVFFPTQIKSSEKTDKPNTDLINEIRGVGGVLMLGGTLALLGLAISGFKQYSFMMASVIFIGIVIGRLLSMGIEGIPSSGVLQAMIVEFILGVFNLYCFVKTFP